MLIIVFVRTITRSSIFLFSLKLIFKLLKEEFLKFYPQLTSKNLSTSEECFRGKRDDDDENIICFRLYSQEYSYGRNISMMWYVGCPLLSVDIIKVMRLVGEGGTNILPRATIPGYYVYHFSVFFFGFFKVRV